MENVKLFPYQIPIEVTREVAQAYIKETLEEFLDQLFQSREYAIYEYLEDHEEDVREFILSGGAD